MAGNHSGKPTSKGSARASVGGIRGAQARTLRQRRNMTLKQMADLTGITRGHLSRFERDEKSVSVATLLRIAEALRVPVATLLGERLEEDLLHVTRAADRPIMNAAPEDGGYAFFPLSGGTEGAHIEAFVIRPSRAPTVSRHASHGGEEVFFVLDGDVELTIANRTIALSKGDYAQFPGHLQHMVRSLSPASEVLIVIARAGHA